MKNSVWYWVWLSGVAFQGRAAPIWPKSRAGCVIWPRPIISPGNVVITAVMPDHSRTNLWRRDHPGTATGYNTTSYWVISLPESFQPLSHWVTQGHWVICHCTWLGNSESSDYWRTNLEGSTTITHFVGKSFNRTTNCFVEMKQVVLISVSDNQITISFSLCISNTASSAGSRHCKYLSQCNDELAEKSVQRPDLAMSSHIFVLY